MEFAWDQTKREANIAKHGLDLVRGMDVLDGRPVFTYASPRGDEARFVSVCILDGLWVALIWLQRDGQIRLISLRRARDAEKRQYGLRYG
jgi:uncharacterized protein